MSEVLLTADKHTGGKQTRRNKMLTSRKIRFASLLLSAIAAVTSGCNQQNAGSTATNTAATGSDKLDRTILPIVEPQRQTYKELDARNAKAPERWEVKAPEGAPNVV